MAATFLYADFLKIIEDKVIHNPITIVAMAEERGLLQIRLEEVLKQEGDKDHVDKAKEKWSPAMQAHFPKTEQKTITIDDIRRRAQNAIRRRKGNLLKDIPSDGLASNGQPGLFGYRWKRLIPRDNWTDQEWEAFQTFLSDLDKQTENQSDDEPKLEEPTTRKKRRPICLVSSIACVALLMMICQLGWWGDQHKKTRRDMLMHEANSRLIEAFSQPTANELSMSPRDYVSKRSIRTPIDPRPLNWDALTSTWQEDAPLDKNGREPPGLFIAGIHHRHIVDLSNEGG